MIYPMATVVLLTFLLALFLLTERFHVLVNGQQPGDARSLLVARRWPGPLRKSDRCYKSMFDMPILFFPVCTLHLVLDMETLIAVLLAWSFVVFRTLHAGLYLFTSQLLYHSLCSWLASACVFGLWLHVLLNLKV